MMTEGFPLLVTTVLVHRCGAGVQTNVLTFHTLDAALTAKRLIEERKVPSCLQQTAVLLREEEVTLRRFWCVVDDDGSEEWFRYRRLGGASWDVCPRGQETHWLGVPQNGKIRMYDDEPRAVDWAGTHGTVYPVRRTAT